MIGDNAYFPHVRPWRGDTNGVEVLLVAPGEDSWDKSFKHSVVLGGGSGIPLAPPFDSTVFNPSGFKEVKANSEVAAVPELKRPNDFIRQARSALAVEIEKIDAPESARKVLELSALGVPVLVKNNDQLEKWLGSEMATVLTEIKKEDLNDPTIREKVSVDLRRIALSRHTIAERLREIRKQAGLTTFREPLVSVIVASNRPEMIERVFNTVKDQDYENIELVIALHGEGFQEAYPDFLKTDLPVKILRYPKETVFGNVLSEASAIAQGEWIAKMDDDDWYGKEHISDLLLAASYSNADLVGKGSEFVYLTEEDITVRRDLGNSEVESLTLGGGALLVRTETLKQTYGWRGLTRGVDVALIDDIATGGGRVWRTHAFGYLLRRTKGHHTWNVDSQYFLRNAYQKWEGFASEVVGVVDE